jgi:hypothetical protein
MSEMVTTRFRVMTYVAIVFAGFAFAACGTAPAQRSEAQQQSPTQTATPEQKAFLDSVTQFLLTSAANDFHSHGPTDPVRFRDVRLGHVIALTGKEQYFLCGQFLPEQQDNRGEWTTFATVQTSGYEQWIGAQAEAFCQSSSVIWDDIGDLSSSLQSQLDSLR